MAEFQEEILIEKMNWHWRNTMRPVRFFMIDARAAFFWIVLLFNLTNGFVWLLTLSVTGLFYFMERIGLGYEASLRLFRGWLAGDKRYGWFKYRRRHSADYE